MVKIKVDKKKLEVIFKCKSEAEMKNVLDVYIKGNEAVKTEALKAFM
jgi:hypothetical protein